MARKSWQDTVLAIGHFVFIVALLPSVFGENKPELFTSVLNVVMLLIVTFTFASLSLWRTAILAFVGALTWMVLVMQVY